MKNFCFISVKAFEERHCGVYIHVYNMYIVYIYARIHNSYRYLIIVDVRFLSAIEYTYILKTLFYDMCIHRDSYARLLVRISTLTGHTTRMCIIYICVWCVPVCICILGMYCFNSLTLIFLFFFF